MITASAIAAAVNPAIEAAVALDPEAGERIERLDGAVLAVEVTGLGLELFVVPHGRRLRVSATAPAEPAVRIAGPPASLARLAGAGGTRMLFSGHLDITGDVTAAKAYKRLFDTLDPDWEEALAGVLGDVAAHETGRLVRGTRAWLARAAAGRRADLEAWLIDEARALPARTEAEAWLAEVDRLRADADRLAARIKRLERRSGGGGR